jgi:hypothetical protein
MAIKVNLFVDQGSTFATVLNLTDDDTGAPVDLTTCTAAGQIRKHPSSVNSVSFGIVLGGNNGLVTLSLSSNTTAAMTGGRYMFDVELHESTSNTTTRILEGLVTVNPEVTR